MFVDVHCHLSFPEFDLDRKEVIARLTEEQVTVLIDPGINVATSRKSIELAGEYDFIFANVGLHPHEASAAIHESVFGELEALAKSPKVVAIGEIGLDYHYPDYNRQAQQDAFRQMLTHMTHHPRQRIAAAGALGLFRRHTEQGTFMPPADRTQQQQQVAADDFQ